MYLRPGTRAVLMRVRLYVQGCVLQARPARIGFWTLCADWSGGRRGCAVVKRFRMRVVDAAPQSNQDRTSKRRPDTLTEIEAATNSVRQSRGSIIVLC